MLTIIEAMKLFPDPMAPRPNLFYMLFAALFIVNTHFCYGRQQKEDPFPSSSPVLVQGSVFCDTCFSHTPLDNGYLIPGASVALECSLNRKTATSVRVEGETDEMGYFKIELPSFFHFKLESCSARLIRSPHASCNVASITTSSNFILTADMDGVLTYNAGYLSFRPRIIASSCFTEQSDSDILFLRGRETLEKDKRSGCPPIMPKLPSIPNLNFPPIMPKIPSIPYLNFPPIMPKILNFPPIMPKIPSIPNLNFPPLPPLRLPNLPGVFPSVGSKPPLPFPFNFPPIPLLTPAAPPK